MSDHERIYLLPETPRAIPFRAAVAILVACICVFSMAVGALIYAAVQ